MITNFISYKQAAQVAVCAITFAVAPPIGVANLVGTLGLGSIGLLGIEFVDKTKEAYLEARSLRLHRIVPHPNFSADKHENAAKEAIQRFKEKRLNSQYPECLDEIVGDNPFAEGYCHGAVSSLLYGIESKGLSIEQSAKELKVEEVFFRHLIQYLWIYVSMKEKESSSQIDQITQQIEKKRFQNFVLFLAGGFDCSMTGIMKTLESHYLLSEEILSLTEALQTYRDKKSDLSRQDTIFNPIARSNSFPPKVESEFYQIELESLLKKFPSADTIRGFISMPNHVMGFQYGKNHFYVFDVFSPQNGGLWKYSDKKDFFRKLRSLVLQAVSNSSIQSQNKTIEISFGVTSTS